MDTLVQDVRFALRTLARQGGFTAVVILTLALGLGANTAIFSVVDAVLLRPLPYEDPGGLVMIYESKSDQGRGSVSPANFVDWQRETRSFAELAGFFHAPFNLSGLDEPEEIQLAVASAEVFHLLGVGAAAGRLFDASDVESGRFGDVVVLSHDYWRRRLGGDPGVVGRTVTINGSPNTVIGVAPAGARILEPAADVWLPTSFAGASRVNEGRYLRAVGRLAPGVGIDEARAEMRAVARRLAAAFPDFNTGWSVTLVPFEEALTGDVRPALLLLLGAVGLLLLVASANVANLMLARAAGREREIAIRAALGAGSLRIFRQLATESFLLVVAAAALGFFLAVHGTGALLALLPADLNLPQMDDVRFDAPVLAFTAAVTLVSALVFGLVPILGTWSGRLVENLREGRGEAGSARHRRLRSGLVVAEIALALVLVIGAGLLLRSFSELRRVDTGLDLDGVLTARVSLSGSRYREPEARRAFFQEARRRVAALPGVESAGAIQWLPLSGQSSATFFFVEGRPRPEVGQEPVTDVRVVTPGYFETVGMPLVAGRTIDERDHAAAPAVAVVNQTLARRFWPGESAVGKRLSLDWGDWMSLEVIGVVGDVHFRGAAEEVAAAIFRPHAQDANSRMNLVIRSAVDPASQIAAVSRAIHEIDPQLPVANFRTLRDYYDGTLARPRLGASLLAAFSVLGLVLAAVGVYGVMSYSVARRTREIGIRMALGAERGGVLALVVRDGLGLAALGVGLGLVGALALSRLLESLLFGVGATDPLTFAAVPVVLLVTAAAASFVPARRASRVDPTVTLRYE